MHGKQVAIGPALEEAHGLILVVPKSVDTDALGTFTGEIPRRLPMKETAIAKARLGMEETGLPIGIASEGSFGPHPEIPFVPLAREIIVFIDAERGLEIIEGHASLETNFNSVTVSAGEDISAFLARAQFPSHALIVRGQDFIEKGIRDQGLLAAAMARGFAHGSVTIETDMRAHMNPTRMAEIGKLAQRLSARLATPCPVCNAPGFGAVGEERGLPCSWCGSETSLVKSIIHGCSACGHRQRMPRTDGLAEAEPQYCPECNP
jgi:hypothetical protein